MNKLKFLSSLTAGLLTLSCALASSWNETTYTISSSDVTYDIGIAIIIVGPGASSAQFVPAATFQVQMRDLVTGSASGLSGGDPSWRGDFTSLKDFFSYGNNSYDSVYVSPGYIYFRETILWTVTGTNGFTRSSGSPTTASRDLFQTSNNRPTTRLELMPD
jgi:hypothetical protein